MSARLYTILAVWVTAGCGAEAFAPGARSADPQTRQPSLLPPLPSAGADRDILRGYRTTLDGRGSYHPLRQAFTVRWTQIAGEPVFLSNANSLSPTFVAPLEEQELAFTLIADDGTWVAADSVRLLVSITPTRLAPRVRAGPDRYLGYGEFPSPAASDILPDLAAGVTTAWEPLARGTAVRAATPPEDDGSDAATIFRLTGERDGLGSAPDYLVLYPFRANRIGQQAPLADLAAPLMVPPGKTFTIDARGSSDANSDALRYRYEQTRGEPIELGTACESTLELTAPSRPQEISLRVYVRDSTLESAAAEVSLVVAPPAEGAPLVAPGADQRSRAGRTVVLDALAGKLTAGDTPPASYGWVQTVGEPVILQGLSEDTQVMSFVAPEAPSELAFAVVARGPSIDSTPAVTRVSVVGCDHNDPPRIYPVATPQEPFAAEPVVVTASLSDPEGDTLGRCLWSAWVELPDSTAEPVQLAEEGACQPQGGSIQLTLSAPPIGSVLRLHLEVCDAPAECPEADRCQLAELELRARE